MTNSTALQTTLLTAMNTACAYGALFSTVPAGSAGTEISGGSPAYARIAESWGTPTGTPPTSTGTAQAFNVASGTSVAGYGTFSASTGGTYQSGVAVTSFTASSQATCTVTPTNAVV